MATWWDSVGESGLDGDGGDVTAAVREDDGKVVEGVRWPMLARGGRRRCRGLPSRDCRRVAFSVGAWYR